MKKLITIIIVLLVLFALIFDAPGITSAVVRSIETCLYTIIPALFGFMALSSYLIRSGLYRLIFKPLYLPLRYVIKLDEEEFGIFLLSLFGGYPVGAKLLSERVSADEQSGALRHSPLLAFCYCPSPGFVISVVGIGLFSSPNVGLAVYLSNVFACVVLAVFLSRGERRIAPLCQPAKKAPINLNVITPSVISASSALFPVCAVMTAFGVVNEVFRFYGIDNALFFAISEISNVSALAPDLNLLPLFAALFSTGGFCILMQIFALTDGKVPLKHFILWRLPAAGLSALFCLLIMPLFDFSVPASAGNIVRLTEAQNPIASVSLLIMAVILVKMAQEKPAV